jgi:hypothetical protein
VGDPVGNRSLARVAGKTGQGTGRKMDPVEAPPKIEEQKRAGEDLGQRGTCRGRNPENQTCAKKPFGSNNSCPRVKTIAHGKERIRNRNSIEKSKVELTEASNTEAEKRKRGENSILREQLYPNTKQNGMKFMNENQKFPP